MHRILSVLLYLVAKHEQRLLQSLGDANKVDLGHGGFGRGSTFLRVPVTPGDARGRLSDQGVTAFGSSVACGVSMRREQPGQGPEEATHVFTRTFLHLERYLVTSFGFVFGLRWRDAT